MKFTPSLQSVEAHGWILLAHPLFLDQMDALVRQVEKQKKKDPRNYKKKNSAKRLAAILRLSFEDIPRDPTRSEYRQGGTLGPEYRHWFRAKFFQQYRLFFRYHEKSRIIVYAWVNDDHTLRAYESKNDAYKIFQKMLKAGRPPDDWDTLLEQAKNEATRMKKHS